jgi:hypothetical protein
MYFWSCDLKQRDEVNVHDDDVDDDGVNVLWSKYKQLLSCNVMQCCGGEVMRKTDIVKWTIDMQFVSICGYWIHVT